MTDLRDLQFQDMASFSSGFLVEDLEIRAQPLADALEIPTLEVE